MIAPKYYNSKSGAPKKTVPENDCTEKNITNTIDGKHGGTLVCCEWQSRQKTQLS